MPLQPRRQLRFSATACDSLGPGRAACRRRAPRLAAVAPPPALPGAKALQDLTATERVVDVAVAATSNLLNGGIFGALFGLVTGAWTHRSFAGAFGEAKMNGKSWGGISCIYAGLQTASRVIRNKDDRFNNVVGACGSGAVFTAKNGPRAAAQGCVSFAALSYLIDVFATPKDAPGGADSAGLSDEAVLRKKR
jgi:Tim17/Tim22/Tim23/Pmp24 family